MGKVDNCHPRFGMSVNPISTREDRLCPPHYFLPCKYHTKNILQKSSTNIKTICGSSFFTTTAIFGQQYWRLCWHSCIQGCRNLGGEGGQSSPHILAGIKAKTSPFKRTWTTRYLPPRIYRPSYGPFIYREYCTWSLKLLFCFFCRY